MDVEDPFLLQLAKAIQAWLWVEGELYSMYAMLMHGANSHLVSATFNSIQSVDSKLTLLNSCFALVFARGSEELKSAKTLLAQAETLNKKRNKLVHEPVSIHYGKGAPEIRLGPSYANAPALVKGQTTHQGRAVVSAEYNPSTVYLLDDHQFKITDVGSLERKFKALAREMRAFQDEVRPKVKAALASTPKPRR